MLKKEEMISMYSIGAMYKLCAAMSRANILLFVCMCVYNSLNFLIKFFILCF